VKEARPRPWFFNYNRSSFRFDLIAGLSAAAVVIPKAMAYAVIAGLPLETGLYTAFVPLVIYGLLGASPYLSVSSTTVLAIMTQVELATLPPGVGLVAGAATLAFLTGVVLIAAGILRLGYLGNFISSPVLAGFKAGVSAIIIVDQFPKLLGFHIVKTGFLRDIFAILNRLPDLHLMTAVMGIGVILLMVGIMRFLPRLPDVLIGVGCAVAISSIFGLKEQGVACVGVVPAGLPRFYAPDFSLLGRLLPGALGIALMSFIESVASGKAFLRYTERPPDANQDLLATGAGNLCGGFFQIFPSGGGMGQTTVNVRSGARTQAAGLVTAMVALIAMLFLAPALRFIPLAELAGVVIFVSFPMINPASFRAIYVVRKEEFLLALIAFAGVVVLGVMRGVLVAVAVSLLTILYHANRPPVYAVGRKKGMNVFRALDFSRHPDDVTYPGLLILRIEGRLNFASAPRALERSRELVMKNRPRVVLLDFEAVPDIEYTALEMFDQADQRLRAQGMELWLCALNPEALSVVRRSSLGKRLNEEGRMFFNTETAVERFTGAAVTATRKA
jgi:sulfate permease, SulP family